MAINLKSYAVSSVGLPDGTYEFGFDTRNGEDNVRSEWSWGQYPPMHHQTFIYPALEDIARVLSEETSKSGVLPRGLGRSYGDSCLNEDGCLLSTKKLNKILSFDSTSGVLAAQSGVTIGEILKLTVPQGWFLPVTPGTQYVTLGGAVANDVHGKNHHRAGSFGNCVKSFHLVRSDGISVLCAPTLNSAFFKATVGGLGLTGFITVVTLQLRKISSAYIIQSKKSFTSLDEYIELCSQENSKEHVVTWVDGFSGKDIRGIFISGNHDESENAADLTLNTPRRQGIPPFLPHFLLKPSSMRIFNEVYFRKNALFNKTERVGYDRFFYPLDIIHNWNRIYGKRGFLQYQFVVPPGANGVQTIKKVFTMMKESHLISYLAVLKNFGDQAPVGMMSFPREGLTLSLDFPNYGDELLRLLGKFDNIVSSAGGAVYPAKDACMSPEVFRASFPNWKQFQTYMDPKMSSSFSRRVGL